jgi:hypothetical protein
MWFKGYYYVGHISSSCSSTYCIPLPPYSLLTSHYIETSKGLVHPFSFSTMRDCLLRSEKSVWWRSGALFRSSSWKKRPSPWLSGLSCCVDGQWAPADGLGADTGACRWHGVGHRGGRSCVPLCQGVTLHLVGPPRQGHRSNDLGVFLFFFAPSLKPSLSSLQSLSVLVVW